MPDSPRHPVLGLFLMLVALLFIASMDAIAKRLSVSYSLPLLVWARFTGHCLLMLVFLAPSMRFKLVATRRPGMQVGRALLLVAASLLALGALRIMPLAETTAIILVGPLLINLLAARFLGETVGPRRWLAIAIGFSGALIIARPGGALPLVGILFALGVACTSAAYMVMTRQMSTTENSFTMLFYMAATGTLVMSLTLPWFWSGPTPGFGAALLIAAMGICSAAGHYLIIRAYHHTPASTLSPVNYFQLLWATLLGWLMFGQFPDAWSIVGMLTIAGSGIANALAERSTRRAAASPGAMLE